MVDSFSKIEIVYYSGTGGTALAAKRLREAFHRSGCAAGIQAVKDAAALPPHDLLLLIFPLHAFNAPEAVYTWLKNIPPVAGPTTGARAAVISGPADGPIVGPAGGPIAGPADGPATGVRAAVVSVSGGGDISPNTAGRASSIRLLEKKGYCVFYEGSLVMPSNIVVATPGPLAVRLLEILPERAERIADDILSGARRRPAPLLIDRLFSKLGEMEKPFARSFGRKIKTSEACRGCGWCAEHCPAGNISTENGRAVFGNNCHLCLCCIYGCPCKALSPGSHKFLVIKEGFSIGLLEDLAPLKEPVDVDELAKGFLWSGVKKYFGS